MRAPGRQPPLLLPLTAAFLLLAPGGARAQVPGDTPWDAWRRQDAQHARYVARVRKEVRGVLDGWAAAWQAGDAEELARHYLRRAVFHLPGGGVTVWARLGDPASSIGRWLPEARRVNLGIVHADANLQMAYVTGRYSYRTPARGDGREPAAGGAAGKGAGRGRSSSRDGEGRSRKVEGKYIMALQKEKGEWWIRSHLFRPLRRDRVSAPGGEGAPGGSEPPTGRRRQRSGLEIAPDPLARQYAARVEQKVRSLLDDWERAWREGAAGRLADHYVERCVVHMPGNARTAWGMAEFRQKFADGFPVADRVELGVLDVHAAERVAYVTGGYSYRISEAVPGGGRERSGNYLMVLRRRGGGWRILSHLFRPSGPASGVSGPGAR